MRDLRTSPFIFPTLLIAIGLAMAGCSSKEDPAPPTVAEDSPSPTPAPTPFIVYTDAEEAHFLVLKPHIEKIARLPETHLFQWSRSDVPPARWDVALVRSWTADRLEENAIDLLPDLEAAYPRHGGDFFVPVSALQKEGQLLALPVLLIPDFLYARNHPEWTHRFDEAAFRNELEQGARLGVSNNPSGDFHLRHLAISEDRIERLDFANPNNAFLTGEVEFAIGPKGWMMEKQLQGVSAVSTAKLGLAQSIPDSGYRLVIARNCGVPDAARGMLRDLVTEGQSVLVGVADGFPIRRSVYSSPRMQAPQFALFRSAFEETLANLAAHFPKD